MIFFPAESYPTNRVRLTLLFGRELIGRGHEIDLVMQATDDSVHIGRHEWGARNVFVGATDSGDGFARRFRKHLLGFWHDLRCLRRVSTDDYDCILVSDKYLLASIAAIVARVKGLKLLLLADVRFPQVACGARARRPRSLSDVVSASRACSKLIFASLDCSAKPPCLCAERIHGTGFCQKWRGYRSDYASCHGN